MGWFSIHSGRYRLEQIRLFVQFMALAGELENPRSRDGTMGLWLLQTSKVHLAGNPAFPLRCLSPARMMSAESWIAKRAELGTNTGTLRWVQEGLYDVGLGVGLGWPVPSFWAGRGLFCL